MYRCIAQGTSVDAERASARWSTSAGGGGPGPAHQVGRRGRQDQALHAGRMPAGQRLGHQATERVAHHRVAAGAEGGEHRGHVVGQVLDGEALRSPVGLAVAAEIYRHHPAAPRRAAGSPGARRPASRAPSRGGAAPGEPPAGPASRTKNSCPAAATVRPAGPAGRSWPGAKRGARRGPRRRHSAQIAPRRAGQRLLLTRQAYAGEPSSRGSRRPDFPHGKRFIDDRFVGIGRPLVSPSGALVAPHPQAPSPP